MAELGVPRFVPLEAETGGPNTSLVEGVAGVAEAASAAIVDKQTKNLRSSLEETAVAGVEAATADPSEELGVVFSNTTDQNLYDQLRTLKGKIAQASGGQKVAVVNRGKRLTQEAMARNPSLRQQLGQEFREFMAFDPNLDALGAIGAASSAEAALAQKQRDEIWDVAYGKTEDGGLGINPDVPFGSKAFVDQYSRSIVMRSETQATILLLNSLETSAELDIHTTSASIQKALVGSTNAIDATFKQQNAQLSRIRQSVTRIATGKGNADDEVLVAGFNAGAKVEMLAQYEAFKNELEKMKTRIPVTQRTTELGTETLQTIDDQIAYISRWQGAIETLTSNPSLAEAMEIESTLRENQWRRDNPRATSLIEDVRRMNPLLEHADVLGIDDILTKHNIGQVLLPTVREVLVDSYVFGTQSRTGGEVSGQQVRNNLHRGVNMAENPYGTVDSVERGKQALQNLAGQLGSVANVYALYGTDAVSQAPVYGQMSAATTHLYELRSGEQYAPETVQAVAALTSQLPNMEMVAEIRKSAAPPLEAVTFVALGEELSDYLIEMPNGGVNRIINGLNTELNARFGGIKLNEMVTPDFSKIEDGMVVLNLNPGAAQKVAQGKADSRTGGSASRFTGVGITQSDTNREAKKLRDYVASLNQRINATLGMVTAADFYKDPRATDPTFAKSWEDYNFSLLFSLEDN